MKREAAMRREMNRQGASSLESAGRLPPAGCGGETGIG
jgi:hypothetical protein